MSCTASIILSFLFLSSLTVNGKRIFCLQRIIRLQYNCPDLNEHVGAATRNGQIRKDHSFLFLVETREYNLRIIPANVWTSTLHNSLRDLEGLHGNLVILEP